MKIAVAVVGVAALAAIGGAIALRARRAPTNTSYVYVRQIGQSGLSVREASHIAFDSQGRLYALDRAGLLVYRSDGTPIKTLVICGQEREQLQTPMAVAIDAGDRIYVADAAGPAGTYGNRIAVYSTSGKFLGAYYGRTLGTTPRRMAAPLSIVCAPQGRVFAADAAGYLWAFSPGGECLSGVPLPSPGSRSSRRVRTASIASDNSDGFPSPSAMARSSQGNLFIASSRDGFGIIEVSEDGRLIRSISPARAGAKGPICSLAINGNDHLFVADRSDQIAEISPRGAPVRTFLTAPSPPGGATPAVSLAVDPANRIWSADTGHDTIVGFTPEGSAQSQFPMTVERQDAIGYPAGIAVDAEGHVFVSDNASGRIFVFSKDGGFIRSFSARGGGPGELSEPRGVAVDNRGRVFVADSDSWNSRPRVSVFARNGRFVREIGGGKLVFPVTVATDLHDHVFVGDFGTHSIQEFTADGTFVRSIGREGRGPGQFTAIGGIAVDGAGRIYAADSLKASRVLVFRRDGKFLRAISARGKLKSPDGVALDGNGHLFVCSDDPAKPGAVLIFTPGGKLVGSMGKDGPGALSVPSGLAADRAGHLYAIDFGHGRVVQFASESSG